MAIGKSFEGLLSRIGYKFTDTDLIENALTHSSYSNEYKFKGLSIPSNERLEFLGDAVLELTVSEYLYDNFKRYGEGKLTRMRQHLVCEKTLAKIASSISLGDYIHLGKGEEFDCRKRPKVLADALEAVIGSMYMDCRLTHSEDYKRVIITLFANEISEAANQSGNADFKTLLQKFVEQDGSSILAYEVIDESGPEHDKKFRVVAKVNNNVVGEGIASSKKDAEMKAAMKALELFGLKEKV